MKDRAIGLFINRIDSNYNMNIWQGIDDGAASRDFNLITYSGGPIILQKDKNELKENIIYENLDFDQIEGIVTISTSIANEISPQGYEMFCSKFKTIPIVSVGDAPDFVYKCLIDNKSGFYNLVDHLIKDHGCRKFVFLSGPKMSKESNERFEAFKKALDDNKIEFNEQLFYTANFMGSQAKQGIKYFVEEKKFEFDAVVAANDDMALAANITLQELGFKIPDDIKIVGFDDIPNALISNPSLSTVRQPIYSQAFKAVNMLIDLIEGKKVPGVVYLPTSTVIRQSCGCESENAGDKSGFSNLKKDFVVGKKDKDDIYDNICNMMKNIIDDKKFEYIREMIDLFHNDLETGKSRLYLARVSSVLNSLIDLNETYIWREIFFYIEKGFSNLITLENCDIYGEMIEAEKDLVNEKVMRIQSQKFTMADLENRNLRTVVQGLGFNFEIGGIHEFIARNFKLVLKINSCYIAKFENDGSNNVKLIAGYNEDGKLDIDSYKDAFPVRRMIPGDDYRLKKKSYFLCPMILENRNIGIIVMGIGTKTGYIYESIAAMLVSCVWGSFLLNDSIEAEKKLSERNKKIESLVKPMIDMIKQVAVISTEKMQTINLLNEMSKRSYSKISETAELIKGVSDNFSKMTEIISIIDDISATVNLVSINASIESTHAGQFGRGFLVIAKEIKKLSESTKKNAEEISQTLKMVIGSIQISINASSESINTFREQEKTVGEILDSLKMISGNMDNLSLSSKEILAIMDEK